MDNEPEFKIRGRYFAAGPLIRCFARLCQIKGEMTEEEKKSVEALSYRMTDYYKQRKLGPHKGS